MQSRSTVTPCLHDEQNQESLHSLSICVQADEADVTETNTWHQNSSV